MENLTAIFFWGFLALYGITMTILSPKALTLGSFFKGEDKDGKKPSSFILTSSIFISWIFAKSVTNAANLGADYGIVGGIAYATYWLCIPLAGFVIYRLRRKFKANGLVNFLSDNYGKTAALAFSAAILIRLFNEVWSNSSVIGGYYGASGSGNFIIASSVFTIITLIYSMKGGLLSSLVTDAIQTVMFIAILLFIVIWIIPKHPINDYVFSGNWTLNGGVDLLLVTILQIFSYPFHDPVLTDRGFICEEKEMLRAFIVSGILGFLTILIFSFIGIHASLENITLTGNVPADVGRNMSMVAFFLMAILMMFAGGSTLDSTFASLSKLIAKDLPNLKGIDLGNKSKIIGMSVMALFAIVGNLPMVFGTNILAATTISGTMVMGLAPIFLLHGFIKPTKIGFHLSFWIGIFLGIAYTIGIIPKAFEIGDGKSALLLGVNLYGLVLCFLVYIIPGLIKKQKDKL